jgi:hypothetical protein
MSMSLYLHMVGLLLDRLLTQLVSVETYLLLQVVSVLLPVQDMQQWMIRLRAMSLQER